jgi:hypothetical protein
MRSFKHGLQYRRATLPEIIDSPTLVLHCGVGIQTHSQTAKQSGMCLAIAGVLVLLHDCSDSSVAALQILANHVLTECHHKQAPGFLMRK